MFAPHRPAPRCTLRAIVARAVAVFLVVCVAACSGSTSEFPFEFRKAVRSGGVYVSTHDAIVYMLSAGGVPRDLTTEQRQALASTTYALGYGTPFLPFTGNRLVTVGPLSADLTNVATATLQRRADCSLTETAYQSVNSVPDITSFVDLPSAQDYLHQLAGLGTQPDVFPRGCVDTTRGKASVNTAMPLTLTAATLRFADLNLTSEQLEVYTVDRATGAKTITALTPGRVKSFLVVDMNGDGLPDIVASGVGYGIGNNGNIAVFLANADGSFRTATSLASAGSTFTIDDLDGDGKPDLVIDNGFDGSGTPVPGVTTMLGNGDGTFRSGVVSATTVARASGPFVTGDFNGDGRPDLLLGAQVLLGNGDGTFREGPALPASVVAEIGFHAAVGDVDRDGSLDVAYTGAGFVQILLGNGDGTFRLGARYASLGPPTPVAISEIDGDGNLDVFVGNASQGIFAGTVDDPLVRRFQVLLGRGDGTFVAAPVYGGAYASNSSAPQLATADFDGDGKVDALVIGSLSAANVAVLPGNGLGGFGAAVTTITTIRPSMVAAADLNGDGKPDVVAAGIDAHALPIVATLINQGGSRFAVERDYALPNFATSVAVGDFDGDGRIDVAVAVGSATLTNGGPTGVYVLFGQADGSLAAPVRIDASAAPVSLAVADLNADGRADLAVADFGATSGTGALHLYLGQANRTFTTAAVPTTTATRYTAVAFADLDGDGKPDLVFGGSVPGASFGVITANLYTALGNGDGSFRPVRTEPLLGNDGNGINAIAVGDFDKDGKADLALGNQADYTEVLLGRGDGTFFHGLMAIGDRPNAIVAVDLDNDRYADLLVGTAGVGTIVFRNAGTVAAWVLPALPSATAPVTPVVPSTGDFAVTATPASGSVIAGGSVQTIVAAVPTADLNQTVTLSCSAGLPAGATCTFTPSALTLTGGVAQSSSLTITTRAASALGSLGDEPGGPSSADPMHRVLLATLFGTATLFIGTTLFARPRRRRIGTWLGLALLGSVLSSCGSDDGTSANGGNAGTTPVATATTYPVTITAASASMTRSTVYSLTVR